MVLTKILQTLAMTLFQCVLHAETMEKAKQRRTFVFVPSVVQWAISISAFSVPIRRPEINLFDFEMTD